MRGLEATHNEVARHAGVGVGTVYRRFPDKEDLVEAIFEDGINEITALAEAALNRPDSWEGLVFFVEEMCQLTARDRGLQEAIYSRTYGNDRIASSRLRLDPIIEKVVEKARADGYLRAGIGHTDMPYVSILAGAVTEFSGEVGPDLWRRYVTIFLEGMRAYPGETPLPVNAPSVKQLDAAMRAWNPAGRR